jgi:hypothetical protein
LASPSGSSQSNPVIYKSLAKDRQWVVICRAVFRPLAASQFQDAMTALVVCERQ